VDLDIDQILSLGKSVCEIRADMQCVLQAAVVRDAIKQLARL
jgi:hypothetical protein